MRASASALARDGYAASPFRKEGMSPQPRDAQRIRGGDPPSLQQYIDILPQLDESQLQSLLTHLQKRLPKVRNTRVLAKFIRRVRKEIRRRGSPRPSRRAIDECIDTPVTDAFGNAQFTSEDIASFRHLYHVNLDDEPWYEGFGEYRFGIFHHLNKLRPAQAFRHQGGYYNTVVPMKMRDLPWDDKCAAALKRDPKVMNRKIIVRQGQIPLSIYEIVTEILLSATLANMGIAPKLYGAMIHEYKRDYYRQDADVMRAANFEADRIQRLMAPPQPRDSLDIWKRPPDPYRARVRMGTADMVFEAFDGDMLGLRSKPGYKAMKPEIARQLDVMFAKVASMDTLCVDIKFENIVYRLRPGNKVELRMIDFGTAFCGLEHMSKIDRTKNLDGQLRAKVEEFRDRTFITTNSQEKRMRHAFMVVIMALSSADRGDDLMRPIVKRMLTTAPGGERLLNGVPMRHYETWFQHDILRVKSGVQQYTTLRFGRRSSLTEYLTALMSMPLS